MNEERCLICNEPPHRFGTTDSQHKTDAVACVNQLLPVVNGYRRALGGLVGDMAFGSVARAIIKEVERQ